MNTQPLALSTRNDLVEGVYRGAIAVVDAAGNLLHSVGNPDYETFLRSAIKMIQAVPVVESSAAERFEFDDAELAVCCASHTAAEYHVRTVRGMLEKLALTEKALGCGGHLPEDAAMRNRLIRAEATPTAIYNNCSGKHTGMLASCLGFGWPVEGYLNPDHPLQRHILSLIADYSSMRMEDIRTGIDGCSLPTYFMPLRNAALATVRFMERASRAGTPDARLLQAVSERPEMVHSEGGYDTELMRALKGRCYAKRGAMGIMLVGLHTEKHGPVGIALKIEDGDNKPMPVIMTNLLERLDLATAEELAAIERFRTITLENWNGIHVGEIRAEAPTEHSVSA